MEDRVWHYHFDADGHLWHEGAELDDPSILHLFLKSMKPLGDGRFQAFCQGEECVISAEDVPYVIQDAEFRPKDVLLKFPGGYEETLDPATLFVGRRNVLYCKVRKGAFIARFNRKSYLDLAKR